MTWDTDIEAAATKLDTTCGKLIRAISLRIFRGVVQKTPVRHGYLRAAWNISLNEPVYITEEGSSGSSDMPATLGHFPTVFITNGLPYAAVVEYGLYPGIGPKTTQGSNPATGSGIFSQQAPAGMVQVTMADVQHNLQETLSDVES